MRYGGATSDLAVTGLFTHTTIDETAMKLLSFEQRWIADILDAMLPTGPDDTVPTAGPDSASVSRFFDSFLDRAAVDAGLGLRAAIWLITLGPLVWRMKLRTFGRLPYELRVEFLETLSTSDIYLLREIPTLVKTVGCFALFADEGTHAALGSQFHTGKPPLWADGPRPREGERS